MKCTYETIIDGARMLFNSEQELDSFLSNRFNELKLDHIDPTLQIDPIQTTIDKLDTITKKIKDVALESVVINEDGDSETILKIPDSIGTTKFITGFGNPDNFSESLVTPFNLKEYLDKKRLELTKEGLSKLEIDKIIDNTQKSWKQLTEYGTEVHELFESLINKNKSFTPKTLTVDQVDSLTNEFNTWIDELKQKHGKNAKFFTEVPIVSEKINETYEKAGIKSINGRIDLLVVDERGYANIYDFKVSRKPVGVWEQTLNINPNTWHSTKKLTAGYQLAIYKAILNQYGITVGNTEIIPVKIDPEYTEDGLIEKLDNVYIQKDAIKDRPYNTKNWHNVVTILPIKTLMDGVDLTETIIDPMSKFVPNYEVETDIQRNEVTVDLYLNDGKTKHIIPDDSSDRKFGKYWIWNKYRKNKKVYCEDQEELKQAITELVQSENAHRGNELSDLADTIQMAFEGYATIDDLANDNRFKADYCKRIFKKYIEGGWEFQNNPDFIAAGIFAFSKNGLLEIVSLHHNATHALVDLGKGNTILGATKTNAEVKDHSILQATNGNVDLIKVMSLLNGMPEVLKTYKINKIASYNIWMQQGTSTYLETLFDNFSELCRIHKVPLNLDITNFASTLESTVNDIRETCGEQLLQNIGDWTFTFNPDDIIQGTNFILNKMQELKSLNSANNLRDALRTDKWDFDDPLQLSYMLLGRALNKLKGYNIYIEKDPTKWFNFTGQAHTGILINSPGFSPSLNIQTIAKIFSVAEHHSRRKQILLNSKIKSGINKYYTYKRRSSLLGGEVALFDNLFRTDENGKFDKSFKLKSLNDNSLSVEDKEMITLFLKLKEELIYNNDQTKINEAKNDDSYYDVPIALGSTHTLIHNKGAISAAKKKIDENLNFLRLLPEQESGLEKAIEEQKVYNKYKIDSNSRIFLLDTYNVTDFETNLEKLMQDMIYTFVNEEVMKEYLPQLQAVKIALQYQQGMFGNISENSIDFIDKFITRNVYSKPIMDPQLHVMYKTLATIKSITTMSTLGFNWRSGFRELLQSVWVNMSRVMANAYGQNMYSKTDLLKAWKLITVDSLKDPNQTILVNILNAEYGLANADPKQIRDRISSSKLGIKNMNSDIMFLPNRAPDMYSRCGILIAKMIHDGCWEAHSVKDDNLIYDFKKDSRFNLLNDPNVNKNEAKYKEQRALYIAMLNQFNKEGWQLKVGDDLPRAYTIQESTSLKSFAELCFGHYDEATQMMIKHMFLGALWGHFKTYLSAKLEQWILKPGTYNQGDWQTKYDENGEMFVRVYTEDENGYVSAQIKLKSELNENDIWEPYKEWTGRPMEGIAYSLLSLGKALKSLDYDKLKEVWRDPLKRSNLKLAMIDLIWMSIMMMIIKAIFSEAKEHGEYGPMSHFLESSLYNSFSDGNIFTVVTSMADMNPPAYSILVNIWDQTTGVVTGDKTVWDAACNSFGALNDLKYFSQELE